MDSHRSGFAVSFSLADTGPGSGIGGLPLSSIRSSCAADLTGIGQKRKMCRRLTDNAGRKKAGLARSAKFTGNKPQAREKRRPPGQLGSFCRSQVAVAAVTVGSMNIKSSVCAAAQKLVAAAPGLNQEAAAPGRTSQKEARPEGPAELIREATRLGKKARCP